MSYDKQLYDGSFRAWLGAHGVELRHAAIGGWTSASVDVGELKRGIEGLLEGTRREAMEAGRPDDDDAVVPPGSPASLERGDQLGQ